MLKCHWVGCKPGLYEKHYDKESNMQVRRFSPDLKTKIPGNHKGMYGVPIQFDASRFATLEQQEALAQRVNGLPILLNRPMHVVAMYFEPHGHMEEHSAAARAMCALVVPMEKRKR